MEDTGRQRGADRGEIRVVPACGLPRSLCCAELCDAVRKREAGDLVMDTSGKVALLVFSGRG